MTDHVQIQEAIAAYVMHAIDPDDRARTEHELLDHLPGCESCSALMRDLRELSGDDLLSDFAGHLLGSPGLSAGGTAHGRIRFARCISQVWARRTGTGAARGRPAR